MSFFEGYEPGAPNLRFQSMSLIIAAWSFIPVIMRLTLIFTRT